MMRKSNFILFPLVLFSCLPPVNKKEKIETPELDSLIATLDSSAKSQQATAVPATSWVYREEEDKMTSGKNYWATLDARELLRFAFPYDGGSLPTLTIRNREGVNNVILSVSKGQFNSSIDGAVIRVRFDDDAPVRYSCSEASDGSPEILFVNSPNKFIAQLKRSKHMIVEAEFFNEGLRQMEFSCEGLHWEH